MTINKNIKLDSLGSTGLKETGGFINEEFMVKLRGQNGIKLYREMIDTSDILGAINFVIKSLVRQVEWRVDTPVGMEEDETAIKWREFIEGALDDMDHTFEDMISEVLSMLAFGFAPFEKVYKLRKGESDSTSVTSKFNDGLWGWKKIEIRAQDTLWKWLFDDDTGDLLGMEQNDFYRGKGTVTIPIDKMILFRTETHKGNPEGRSLLRSAVRSYMFLKRIQELEAIGIERELAGMPVMEVPGELLSNTASPEEKALKADLELMIQQVRRDERYGGLFPSELDRDGNPTGFKFKLLSTGGKRQIETDPVIRRYESRIAMVFLAEFIMIGTEKVGTESLFQGKSNLFGMALGTIMDVISTTFNKSGINTLMKMNGVPREYWPVLTHGDIATPELDKMGSFVKDLAASGVLSGGNKKLENKLLEMANLPIPPEELDDDVSDTGEGSNEDDAIKELMRLVKTGQLGRKTLEELMAEAGEE